MLRKVLIFILTSFSFIIAQEQSEEIQVNTQNFVLENIEGEYVELEQFIGKGPILLSFWATWCKPCKEELKEYNKLYKEFSDSGLTVLAVSIDNEKSMSKVKPYIKTNGYDFTVLLDPNSEVARMYYARMVPYSLIIDKTGKVIYTHLGYKKGDELEVRKIIITQLEKNNEQ